jgi:hypothetical protein
MPTSYPRAGGLNAYSNKLICGESWPSDDPACPLVSCSELMKEILGKLMGL